MNRFTTLGFNSLTALLLLGITTASAQQPTSELTEQQKVERSLVAAQKICPVSGKKLDSMGGPLKAEVDGQTVFLCCKGCVGRPLNPKHWAAVESNLRMAHLALAQKICPVTGKDLFSMGGPIKTKFGERELYVCCKGCLKGTVAKEHADQIKKNWIAAQGKCPIMGKELPENPKSIVVKGRTVFVCCPPCTEKIKADPDKHLATVNKLLSENLSKRRNEVPTRR